MVRPLLVRILIEDLGLSPIDRGLLGGMFSMAGLSDNSNPEFAPSRCIKEWAFKQMVLTSLALKNSLVGFEDLKPYKICYLEHDAKSVFSKLSSRFAINKLYIPLQESSDHVDFILYAESKKKSSPILIAGKIAPVSSPEDRTTKIIFYSLKRSTISAFLPIIMPWSSVTCFLSPLTSLPLISPLLMNTWDSLPISSPWILTSKNSVRVSAAEP